MPERFETTEAPSYSMQSAIYKYLFASKFTANKLVLDIACGIGYGSNIIKNTQPSSSLVAGDNYFSGVQYGRSVYSNDIRFFTLDVLNLPFTDETFDIVVSFETLEHLTDHNKFLMEIKRVLKKDGKLICSTPNREWSSRVGIKNKFHLKEYTHDEIYDIFTHHFKKVISYGQLETASEILYRFPFVYKAYKILRPLLVKIFSVKEPEVVIIKSLNSKFEVKDFWPTSPYLIFVVEK